MSKTTPEVALSLVCMNIANATFLLAETQIPYEKRTTVDMDGKEHKSTVSVQSTMDCIPYLAGFETYFAPLTRDDNGRMNYLPDVNGERRKYIWGPTNNAAEFNFEVHKNRCAHAVDLMAAFKDELSTSESTKLLVTAINQRQRERTENFVILPPAVPEKLHVPTLERLAPCREFIADRAAFALFCVHSALVNYEGTRGDWTRRSRMMTTGGKPHIEKALDELFDIAERGVALEEEGDFVQEAIAENDHYDFSVMDMLTGKAVKNERNNKLPIVEYERADRWLVPAQAWMRWVEVLKADQEFSNNVEQTILKAQARSIEAQKERASTASRITVVPIKKAV